VKIFFKIYLKQSELLFEIMKYLVNSRSDLFVSRKLQALAKGVLCYGDTIDDFKNYTNCNGCYEALRAMKIPIKDMFIKCKFRGRVINCTESFTESIVNYQFCYTFNELGVYRSYNVNEDKPGLTNEDWNIDDGYKPTASMDTFPRRALKAGKKVGFSILLASDHNQSDQACRSTDLFYV
jgi:Amiloride-sensitive sodium channel